MGWVRIKDREPAVGRPVLCRLQHWHTENIKEHRLVRVAEDDVEWRTADGNSEVSYDWAVIEWLED